MAKKKDAKDAIEKSGKKAIVYGGRISGCGDNQTRRPTRRNRTINNLDTLKMTADKYHAIEFIVQVHPDARMAVNTMLRLAGGGGNIEFTGVTARQQKKLKEEWREFCQGINEVSGGGMDGLVNSIHKSLILYNGAAEETVVRADLSDVEDVYLILPYSISWELEDSEWVPYQWHDGVKWDLRKCNFLWQALDPDVGKPDGSPYLEAALTPLEYQMQYMEDSAAVLRRMGYPRNDIEIDRAAVLAGMTQEERVNPKKRQEFFDGVYEQISHSMAEIGPTDDLVHYDDIKVNNTNKDNARTIDLRAYTEIIDPQVMNGLGCLGVLLNRTTGVTETWGTVQFKIVADTVAAMQRCSKRMIEHIAGIWLRLHGVAAAARYTPNVVDVENELQRLDLELKKMERARRAEEYGWADKAHAAASAGYDDVPKNGFGDGLSAYAVHDTQTWEGTENENQSETDK